jgi:hypothetical protein
MTEPLVLSLIAALATAFGVAECHADALRGQPLPFRSGPGCSSLERLSPNGFGSDPLLRSQQAPLPRSFG